MTTQNTNPVTAPQTVCAHFGIRYSPFTDTFPIAEPYATKGESLLLERMKMLLSQGKSVSVTGEPGSGKSMLIKTLLGNLEQKSFRFAYVPGWIQARCPLVDPIYILTPPPSSRSYA